MVAAKVLLIDGPLEGKVVLYGHPLPGTLVVAERREDHIRWHDYSQTERTNRYRHSVFCPCAKWDQPPVDLDTVLCW